MNLDLNNQEVDNWLGDKFDEKEEDYLDKFSHDIPLQRSLSLDGGKDIFNYLDTISSDWSVGTSSVWTVHSDRDSRLEQYRGFEDIPASPRVKSRRVSFDTDQDGSGLALSVLKSYKGFDSSTDVTPQIRKLRRNFSFHQSLQELKSVVAKDEKTDVKDGELESEVRPTYRNIVTTSEPEEKAFHQSLEELKSVVTKDEDELESEVRPTYRNIVAPSEPEEKAPRKRRVGIPLQRNLSFEWKKPEFNPRKEILKQTVPNFKSCEDLRSTAKIARRESADVTKAVPLGLIILKDSYQGVEAGAKSPTIRKLKKNFSFVSPPEPYDVDRRKYAKYTNTSNVVEISRNCDCRMCSEEDREVRDERSVWRRFFCKLFTGTVSQERKAYWDENNNLNESDMYKCLMHTLKLLFGLWLRHLDHN